MSYKLIVSIAKALLIGRWRQTLVAAAGVTFSITMFITLLAFMTGLNKLLDGLILNRTPHIRLFNEVRPNQNQPVNAAAEYKTSHNFIASVKSGESRLEIYNSATIMQAIRADNRVFGLAPKIKTQVFYNNGSVDFAGAIDGIDAMAESKLYHFEDYIVSGKATDLKNVSNSIILGKPIGEKLLANIGDVVHVTSSKGDPMSLKVVGFFQSGILDIDKVQSYTSLTTAQKLLGKTNSYITDIQVNLKDLKQAPEVAKEYAALFDTDAEDIQTANSQFETGSSIRTIISYAVGITLLIVAGFGIYNILNMMIYEKMDSIAILKATGFSGTDVNLIFITIALSIGFFGGLAGLFFGFLLSSFIDQIPFHMTALPTVTTYPINHDPAFYWIAIVFSLVTTYFAGLFPARKASKVDPVVIIRGK
jgi:lipoprotein-releasing system permease protein